MVCSVRVRLKAASLLAISVFLVLLVVPTIDLPETNFDEANTPTNEMVVQDQASCLKCIASPKAFVPGIFRHTRQSEMGYTPLVRTAQLTNSPCFQIPLSTLRC